MLPADLFSIPLSKDLALLIAIKHNQSVASRKTPEPKIIIRIKSHTGPRFIKKITIRIRIHNPKILFSKICIFFAFWLTKEALLFLFSLAVQNKYLLSSYGSESGLLFDWNIHNPNPIQMPDPESTIRIHKTVIYNNWNGLTYRALAYLFFKKSRYFSLFL